MSLLDAALTYHKLGFSIFPCNMMTPVDVEEIRQRDGDEAAEKFIKANAKTPKVKWTEYQKRKATETEIRAWFTGCDELRTAIAIVTGEISGLTVVDVDDLNLLPEIKKRGLGSPLVSRTGKGLHFWYSYAPGIKTTTHFQGIKGLDIRNDGGYILAPPSPHYTGRNYHFLSDELEGFVFTVPPNWLFETARGAAQSNSDFLPLASQPVNIKRLLSALAAILPDNYDIWYKVGMALKQLLGESGREIWREWSATSTKYNPDTIDAKWDSFESGHPSPVTAGTIYHLAKENGWKVDLESTEPVPLPDGLLPVKPFAFDLLPDLLRPWAQDICERMQCPADFVAVGIMAGLGSLIGCKIGIRPQSLTDWTLTPNQWAIVVGRPGVMKSPALEQALAPLKKLAAKANDQYAIELAEYELEEKAAALKCDAAKKEAAILLKKDSGADLLSLLSVDKPEVPALHRYIATDSTPEALGELLRQNPNGLLVHRDEIVSLLKGLDREDRAEGRGFYLTGWNGDSGYTFDRIGRGMNLHIPAVCISLLGGTQPGKLAEYIRNAVNGGTGDDGLIQRFGLLVWPDTDNHWKDVDRRPNDEAKREAHRVFDWLDKLDPTATGAQQDRDHNGEPDGIPYLRFDQRGQDLFLNWRTDLESRLRSGDLHPALESHLSKYRKLVPGLALIIHLAEGGTGPVTEGATLKALSWSEYLEPHARRAYGCATHRGLDAAKAILKHIRKGDLPKEFSGRDVYRNGWAHLADREQVQVGLQLLLDYDWLREERRTDTGGRNANIFSVNPKGFP